MSLDLIEIALDRMTDFVEFERLATSVMYLDGWHDIRPLGGKGDLGQDAVSERFFAQPDTRRTVFQYTLQQYLPGKVTDTIEKLRANQIDFSELVVVTPHSISTETGLKMKKTARADHSVRLDLYGRDTIVARLGDLSNGVFHRHFPDIRAQVDDLTRAAEGAALPGTALERTLLQVSLALTFRSGAHRARRSVLDHFVLAVILDQPDQSARLDTLAEQCSHVIRLDRGFSQEQLSAAIARLARTRLISRVGDLVEASPEAISEVATSTVRLSDATNSFAADIVANVTEARGERLSEEERRRVARNVRAALAEIARARGAAVDGAEPQNAAVPQIVRWQLNKRLADLVVAALADALRTPTPSQADTLARWTRAYVGFALMGLDPVLAGFQASKFSSKTFFLDTDIVLEATIAARPGSAGMLNLLRVVATHGCRLVVPESVVAECVRHAALSENTYRYFGSGLLQLAPAVVEEQVWNAFVAGYYYACTAHTTSSRMSYERYLANYYERANPREFFGAVIKETLPDGIEIQPADFGLTQTLADDEVQRFAEALQQDLAERSKKARYRTEEHERELARTDATLYLSTLYMNPHDESWRERVLGGTCYLLTETGRYERVARSIGLTTKVTVRPALLASVFSLIGDTDISPEQFVRLFDNPLLERAVSSAWPDMEKLMRSGVDVRGQTLTRLHFDLDQALHRELTALDKAQDAEEQGQRVGMSSDQRFVALVRSARDRGYSLVPEVEGILDQIEKKGARVEELEQLLDDAQASNEELEQGIAFFGKRRRRYLRRLKGGRRRN